MMTDYAKLVTFSTIPTFNTVPEAKLAKRALKWIGGASEILTNEYKFVCNYSFNGAGYAVSVNVCVYYQNNPLGCYDPNGNVSLMQVIEEAKIFSPQSTTPSTFPSEPSNYYVPDYYVPNYYL